MKEIPFYTCTVLIVVCCLSSVYAQSRISVPGAVPIPLRSLPYRNERLVNGANVGGGPNVGLVRFRRPVLAARQQHLPASNLAEEAKPVTEDPESGETPSYYVPHNQPQQQQQQQHHQQQQQHQPQSVQHTNILYRTDENGEIFDTNRALDSYGPTRFGSSSTPAEERIVPTTIRPNVSIQRFGIQPKPVLRARPEYREPRPQFEPNNIQPTRRPQQHQSEVISQPRTQSYTNHETREKKPVAQILRKYREENEDGTITWGFENDDGSYKEEIIGIDCVTRGRYGYIDPDGVKREYNYETGIVCDPSKRDQEDSDDIEDGPQQNDAYVDYQENQMVLPNGQRISLSGIGKNKSRRPNRK